MHIYSSIHTFSVASYPGLKGARTYPSHHRTKAGCKFIYVTELVSWLLQRKKACA